MGSDKFGYSMVAILITLLRVPITLLKLPTNLQVPKP